MKRVRIIQPVIPGYRIPFYHRLLQIASDWDILVSASQCFPGEKSLYSIDTAETWQDINHPAKTIGGTPFIWQKGMTLPVDFGYGDVLVVVAQVGYLSSYPLMWAAKRRGASIVWWGHGHSKISAWVDKLKYYLARFCDVVLLYYREEIPAFLSRGFKPENIFSIQNAIDQTPIEKARDRWDTNRLLQFRKQQGLEGCKVLLYCARLMDMPRFKLGLRAVANLIRRDPSYQYVIIGQGACGEQVLAESRRLGINNHVRMLGALYDQDALAPWFLISDCLVMPRQIGLSVFHAFSYGLPIVTHDKMRIHGPEVSVLKNGYNGFLYRDGDVKDLCEKIISVCNNSSYRRILSQNAVQTASEYKIETMAENFHKAIEAAHTLSLRHA